MQTITSDVDQTSRQNSSGNEKKSIAVPKWRKAQPEKILPVNLEKFDTHFALLIEFQKKYKRDPEHRDDDHKKLYYWVVNMRAKKRNETIPSLFLKKLNSINFIWEKPTLHTSPLFYKTEELIKNGSNIPPGKIVFNWLSREIKRYQNNAQPPEMRIKFEQLLQINQASDLENETVAAIWNKNHKAVLKYKENRSSKGLTQLAAFPPIFIFFESFLSVFESPKHCKALLLKGLRF